MYEVAGPSAEDVRAWLTEIDEQVLRIQGQLEPLLREQGRLRERRKLLGELLTSFGEDPLALLEGRDGEVVLHAVTTAVSPSARRESVRERVHREVVSVLRETGRPLHINDLLAEYVKRGYQVPGQGKAANISVHLSGWDDIEIPERGVYGLVDFTPDDEGDR
jgi:hypothetical protein